ncbi:MAG: FG-GAP repeat protein [Nitrospira sp.]|nr:FG-GAP repeat protein [Nitrospira sp.]
MFTTTRFTDYPPGKLGRVLRILILALLSLGPTMIQGCGSDETPQTAPQTVAPLKQQAYVKASNTESDDWFGTNIVVDGDTLVVGVSFEDSAATGINGNQADNSAPDSGAVYVFTRTGGVWSQQAYVKAANTEAGDESGSWVAIAGDTLVVGAPFEDSAATGINGNQADNSAPDSGAVCVFTRAGGVWSQQAYEGLPTRGR